MNDTSVGSHYFTVVDRVGNASQQAVTIVKDTTPPPAVTLTVPSPAPLQYTVTWAPGVDPAGIASYLVEGCTTLPEPDPCYHHTVPGDETRLELTGGAGGLDRVTVKAVDGVGNVSAGASGTVSEWQAVTKNYAFGGQPVAVRHAQVATPLEAGTVAYLVTDHLSSTSLVLDPNGVEVSQTRYYPFGEVRWQAGVSPTDKTFTGQRRDGFGLLDYNARFYDPYLNRWLQPDTIVPEGIQGVQAWDRYAYANNNPVRYTDPSGHCIGPLLAVCIAVGTFIVDNAGIIATIATVGAITSFVGPSDPDPVLMNDPAAAQQALENSLFQAGLWLTGGQAALEFGYMMAGPSLVNTPADDILSDNATVGRWMSPAEYAKMEETKMLQEGAGGTTYVLYPASPGTYANQAAPGSVYVEFEVPASSIQITNSQLGWGRINGPNSFAAKMNEKLGLPVPQLPPVQNPRIVMTKPKPQ